MKLSYNVNIKIEGFEKLSELSKKLTKLLKPGNIALSGGSTYLKLLKDWALYDLKLKGVNFYPVDERVIDFTSEDSNWGNTYRNFLSKFNKEPGNHFIDADIYNNILDNIDMDTIFLGVGDDGHTASLFNIESVFRDKNKKVISTISPKEPKNRISFTGEYIIKASNIIIIFLGDGKKNIVDMVISGHDLPITTLLKKVNRATIYIHKPLLGDSNE